MLTVFFGSRSDAGHLMRVQLFGAFLALVLAMSDFFTRGPIKQSGNGPVTFSGTAMGEPRVVNATRRQQRQQTTKKTKKILASGLYPRERHHTGKGKEGFKFDLISFGDVQQYITWDKYRGANTKFKTDVVTAGLVVSRTESVVYDAAQPVEVNGTPTSALPKTDLKVLFKTRWRSSEKVMEYGCQVVGKLHDFSFEPTPAAA